MIALSSSTHDHHSTCDHSLLAACFVAARRGPLLVCRTINGQIPRRNQSADTERIACGVIQCIGHHMRMSKIVSNRTSKKSEICDCACDIHIFRHSERFARISTL